MELGISSFTYGWNIGLPNASSTQAWTETTLCDQAAKFGVRRLQIGDNLPLHLLPEDRHLRLQQTLAAKSITLEIGARRLTPSHALHYLRLCETYKAPLLRFIIDGDGYEPAADVVIGIIKDLLPEFKKRNVVLGIENHDRFKARVLAKIMDAVAHENVGICLDCVNSMGAGEGLEQVAEILAPYTVNLHIKDFAAERLPHKMGFTISGVPTGKGLLDLPWLMEKILPFKRCKSAILEQWVVPEIHMDDTIAKERSWADESMTYLKTLKYFNS